MMAAARPPVALRSLSRLSGAGCCAIAVMPSDLVLRSHVGAAVAAGHGLDGPHAVVALLRRVPYRSFWSPRNPQSFAMTKLSNSASTVIFAPGSDAVITPR
jgi:hypothetical protein